MRTLAIVLALCLGGCVSVDRHGVLSPTPAHIPASLKRDCKSVTDIPDRALTETELSSLWAADRRSLGKCGRRLRALAKAADALEKQGQKQ